MKFAIITDCHYGPAPWYFGENRIMSDHAETTLTKIIHEINSKVKPEFVMQLGDLIQDNIKAPNRDEDLQNMRYALNLTAKLNAPVYHVAGNHESATLSKDDLAKLYGYDQVFYSFDTNDHHVIVLYCEAPDHKDMLVSQAVIDWLAKDLEVHQKPTLVFLHHQLIEHDLESHYWFKGKPDKAFVQNASEVIQLLTNSGNVVAVFNGHMHINNYLIHNNIPFFTIQSMVEDVFMDGRPSETYAVVEVNDKKVSVSITGTNPETYHFDPNQM